MLPDWFKQEIPGNKTLGLLRRLNRRGVNTVCQEAKCPNLSRCFASGELTFMILGNTCTRSCRFCSVASSSQKRGSVEIDFTEPEKISESVKELGLSYVVITSVTRDDLPDGGAGHFAKTIGCILKLDSKIKVEVLIPDFQGKIENIKIVADAGPAVAGHNLETVKRLSGELRPGSDYQRSLEVLRRLKRLNPRIITKSSLMLGLGESQAEVTGSLRDLRRSGCDIVVLGQYLAPSAAHYPVKEFVSTSQFQAYKEIALGLRFKAVMSEPLARSSYRAKELLCMT